VEGVTDQLMVARFQEDGSLDSTFSGTGMLLLDVADGAAAQDMELRPDGRIVLGGYAMEAGTKQLLLVQLMADGALDASFGTAGIVTVDLGFSIQSILAITLTPSGSLIAAGGAGASVSDSNALLASFSSTGELDTGFSTNGWLTVATGEGANSFTDVLLDQDGMILACGQVKLASSFYYQLILTRRALNGAVDPTFGTNGTTIPDLQYGGGGMCLALQNDGKILVGGVYGTGNNLDAMVARFTPGMSVGINEPEAAEPLPISPNPARDHIRITLPDPGHAYALRIHDASGRIVQQEQLGATDRPLVDVRGLAEGTYQLVLTDGEQLYRASCIVAR